MAEEPDKGLHVALGGNNLGEIKSQRRYPWHDFRTQFLAAFHESPVTMAEFARMTREQKARVKNAAGWFVGGAFEFNDKGKRWRSRSTLRGRSMVVPDLDHLKASGNTPDDIIEALDLLNLEYVLYSTPSSVPDDIRLRLVVPLQRGVKPEHYQPISRWLAKQIDIEAFDHTGFEEARLMYLPVCLADGPQVLHHHAGEWLDPRAVLATYDDWSDFAEWPSSSREGGARQPNLKAEDPREKRGAIGAFCRCFSVQDAIERWLTDYFEAVDDHTYLPTDSTGAPGARVYDDGMFLYNNHETGPTSQRNLNAFDLVRLCLFHELDGDVGPDADVTKLPSYKRMMDFALQQPEVVEEMSAGEFDDVPGGDWDPSDPEVTRSNDDVANGESRFDVLMRTIDAMPTGLSTRAQLRGAMMRIANARFSPTDEQALLRAIQPKYEQRTNFKALEAELKSIRSEITTEDELGEVHDLELEVIQEFESEWFPGGTLKRVGKKYWTFDQGLWSMRDGEEVEGKFAETIIRIRKERPDDSRELAAMVGETKTSALTGSLHKLTANLIAARNEGEDPLKLMRRFDLPIVNTRNCELHFDETGQMWQRDHDPANFYTARVDTDFDPGASAPLYTEFMQHVFANAEDPMGMISFTEEIGGYTLNMSRWNKIWVMLYGETNTGKTTWAEIITALLGGSAIEKSLHMLDSNRGNEFRDQALIGKLAYVDDDMDKGAVLPDGAIKRVSEEKIIQTAIKFGDDIRFVCRAFPIVCTNHWPRTQDITDAFVQRSLVVPFRNPYIIGEDASDQIKYAMLRDERSGILNQFLRGLKRLRQRGHFALPIDAVKARAEWLTHANPVAAFAASCLEASEGDTIKPKDLFERYGEWHYDEYGGSGIKPLPKHEFYRRCDAVLGTRGFDAKGAQVYRGWRAVSIATPMQREFEDLPDDFDNDDLLD